MVSEKNILRYGAWSSVKKTVLQNKKIVGAAAAACVITISATGIMFNNNTLIKQIPLVGLVQAEQANETLYISSAKELNDNRNNLLGKKVVLTQDIDLSGYPNWTPINVSGDFELDGGGHTISGLNINSSSDYQGLFGQLSGTVTISNLGIISSSITGNNYVGAIAGSVNDGIIDNCYVGMNVDNNVRIVGNTNVGGLIGGAHNLEVRYCYNLASVSSYNTNKTVNTIAGVQYEVPEATQVGGIVGFIKGGSIDKCYNAGIISKANMGTISGGSTMIYGATGSNLAGTSYAVGSVTGGANVNVVTDEYARTNAFITDLGGSNYWYFNANSSNPYPNLIMVSSPNVQPTEDTTAPTVTATQSNEFKQSHTIEITISENVKESNLSYYWSQDGQNAPTGTGAWPSVSISNNKATITESGKYGTWYLWIGRLTDEAGNVKENNCAGAYNFDNTAPEPAEIIINNTKLTNGQTYSYSTNTITVTYTEPSDTQSGVNFVSYHLYKSSNGEKTGDFNKYDEIKNSKEDTNPSRTLELSNGLYWLILDTIDNAGNTSSQEVYLTINEEDNTVVEPNNIKFSGVVLKDREGTVSGVAGDANGDGLVTDFDANIVQYITTSGIGGAYSYAASNGKQITYSDIKARCNVIIAEPGKEDEDPFNVTDAAEIASMVKKNENNIYVKTGYSLCNNLKNVEVVLNEDGSYSNIESPFMIKDTGWSYQSKMLAYQNELDNNGEISLTANNAKLNFYIDDEVDTPASLTINGNIVKETSASSPAYSKGPMSIGYTGEEDSVGGINKIIIDITKSDNGIDFENETQILADENLYSNKTYTLNEEGLYWINIITYDKAGNHASNGGQIVRIENTAPEAASLTINGEILTGTSEASPETYNSAVTIGYDGGSDLQSGIDRIILDITKSDNGIDFENDTQILADENLYPDKTYTLNEEGLYWINVLTYDKAGNHSSTGSQIVKIDNPNPDNPNPDDETSTITITINGDNPVFVEVGSQSYEDAGATANSKNGGNVNLDISGQVNLTVVGEYPITYTATDENGTVKTAQRIVKVVDTTKPVITLKGQEIVTVELGDSYTDEGATAHDNYDKDITRNIAVSSNVNTNREGEYTVTYNVSDSSNNAAETVTRTVKVVKTTKDVTGVTINVPAGELIIGEAEEIIATITPIDATNKEIIWTSSDESIATVDENGLIRAVGEGTVTITAKTVDGSFTATTVITVRKPQGDELVFISDSYIIGKDMIIKAISPETTFEEFKTMISSNKAYEVYKELKAESIDTSNTKQVVQDNDIIETGMKLKVEDRLYTIVVKGDINKDGRVSLVDIARLQKHMIEMIELKDEGFYAADVNFDHELDLVDLSRIMKYMIGLFEL